MTRIEQDRPLGKQQPLFHSISWIGAAFFWFFLFFLPLHLLGWWATAFPPWIIVFLFAGPLASATSSSEPSLRGLSTLILLWAALPLLYGAIGYLRKSLLSISIAIHLMLPLPAIVLALYIALELNGGNLKGTS